MYYVYMLKNKSNQLYIGVSENVQQRVQNHNDHRGAQFTKNPSKFLLVFIEPYSTLAQARAREIQLKKWRREKKEILIGRYQAGLSTKSR